MELDGKHVLILVENMFHDLEFWVPYYRMQEAGATVEVVGTTGDTTYTGKFGTTVMADVGAESVRVAAVDGVIVPGGYAPDMMRRYPSMVNIVREGVQSGKLVAAICHAGWMLASAKILEGRRVTSFFAIKDDLIHAGADWVDEAVVVDGNLITSRTPKDLPAFMRAIVAGLR